MRRTILEVLTLSLSLSVVVIGSISFGRPTRLWAGSKRPSFSNVVKRRYRCWRACASIICDRSRSSSTSSFLRHPSRRPFSSRPRSCCAICWSISIVWHLAKRYVIGGRLAYEDDDRHHGRTILIIVIITCRFIQAHLSMARRWRSCARKRRCAMGPSIVPALESCYHRVPRISLRYLRRG